MDRAGGFRETVHEHAVSPAHSCGCELSPQSRENTGSQPGYFQSFVGPFPFQNPLCLPCNPLTFTNLRNANSLTPAWSQTCATKRGRGYPTFSKRMLPGHCRREPRCHRRAQPSAILVTYSSSVEMSPTSCPSSCAFSSRRMIFPLRVFGSFSTTLISAGTPMGPSVFRTWSFSAASSVAVAV
jgi:hypothetical protein